MVEVVKPVFWWTVDLNTEENLIRTIISILVVKNSGRCNKPRKNLIEWPPRNSSFWLRPE